MWTTVISPITTPTYSPKKDGEKENVGGGGVINRRTIFFSKVLNTHYDMFLHFTCFIIFIWLLKDRNFFVSKYFLLQLHKSEQQQYQIQHTILDLFYNGKNKILIYYETKYIMLHIPYFIKLWISCLGFPFDKKNAGSVL